MSLNIIRKIKEQKIVPLFYSDSFEVSKSITKALYEAGIRVIEYTNRGEKALDNFRQLKELSSAEFPDLSLGIGTVKNISEMDAFIDIKADFIITPIISEELVKHSLEKNILLIPGCFTPSEVNVAYQNGLRMVKVFPADVVGKNYVKSISPVFSEMEFMLTGGISADAEDISEWMSRGAVAVGLGSALIKKDLSYDQLKEKVEQLLSQLNSK